MTIAQQLLGALFLCYLGAVSVRCDSRDQLPDSCLPLLCFLRDTVQTAFVVTQLRLEGGATMCGCSGCVLHNPKGSIHLTDLTDVVLILTPSWKMVVK